MHQPLRAGPWSDKRWWLFCLLLLALKIFLLAIDPWPKFFMGDSGSYLWTAVSKWIPPDRSFSYGFLLRWISVSTQSLTPLLLLQTFLGAVTASLVAVICRQIIGLPWHYSYLAGFLCAIDPLQLVWERYVMTETVSLFLYAAMLLLSFYYLQGRRLWQLVGLQLLAVLLLSFRISYLLVVQASTILLPVLAFAPSLASAFRKRVSSSTWTSVAKSLGLHLALSIFLMLCFHLAYKQINSLLTGRPPAYLYSSGLSILATWAPALQPSDSPDPRLARILAQGSEFHLTDIQLRNSQLYSPGFLVQRWKQTEPDLTIADEAAKKTALNSLFHRPQGILILGFRTFFGYFDRHRIHRQAKSDLGLAKLPPHLIVVLSHHFGLTPPRHSVSKSPTVLQRYFLRAQPYYYVVLFSPLLCAGLFFFFRRTFVFLLFAHSSIFLGTNSFLAVTASVRYLQPMSFLTILIFACLLQRAIADRPAPQSSPNP